LEKREASKVQRKFVVSDPEKCTGCGVCELVCSAVKEGGFNPLFSRIRMSRIEPFAFMAIACRLCETPKCVKSCPRKALTVDEETGIILVDEQRCDGCRWCMEACEFGVIFVHKDKRISTVCDLCQLDPKCVTFCPQEALSLMTGEELGQKMRRRAFKKLLSETLETKTTSKGSKNS
jgi:carbon-monoxide dehydrogenase iron sulfur subunit